MLRNTFKSVPVPGLAWQTNNVRRVWYIMRAPGAADSRFKSWVDLQRNQPIHAALEAKRHARK